MQIARDGMENDFPVPIQSGLQALRAIGRIAAAFAGTSLYVLRLRMAGDNELRRQHENQRRMKRENAPEMRKKCAKNANS